MEKERNLSQELHDLLLTEESYNRQKSEIRWIQEGDQNTEFFHKRVAGKQSRNSLKVLFDDDGNKLEEFTQISDEAVPFFQKLIGTDDSMVSGCS